MNATMDAAAACEVLAEATGLLRDDPDRNGPVVHFGSAGQLVVTGDMHGNLANFNKLCRFCNFQRSPGRRVLLQELIHQDLTVGDGMDHSIDLLLRVAALKVAHPDSVFIIQSNHELAQLLRQEITKGGRSVISEFDRGVAYRFGRDAGRVLDAVAAYIRALPLAARTASGIFIGHSLPEPARLRSFDYGVFAREPTDEDLSPGGPAYSLVWGRFHTPADVDQFAQRLGVQHVVVGHTPQEFGHATVGRMIILASDHAHGTFLPVDLARRYESIEELEAGIRKFVSVA